MTIWLADSFDEAISFAEREAEEYSAILEEEYLGFAQAFSLGERVIEPGSEVFSLMRDSALEPREYLDHFFDTGSERQGPRPRGE